MSMIDKLAPWYPLNRPIFTFLIIERSGIPIFSYPSETSDDQPEGNNTVLLSGLLTAINSFAREISGDDIRNLSFGSYIVTISRGLENTLCVLLCDADYASNIQAVKSLHIEITSLVYSIFPNIGNFEYDYENNKKLIRATFEPFYKLKIKQYLKGINKH